MLGLQNKAVSFSVQVLFLHQDKAKLSPNILLPCGHQSPLPSHLFISLLKSLVGFGTRASKSWEFVFILGSIARPSACRASPQDYLKKNHHFRSNSKGLQISRRLHLSHR